MNDTTEQDPGLRDAYERLGSALHPPADGPARVAERIAVRRRRRRTGGGLAALALVTAVGAAAVTTGGEPDRAIAPATPPDGDPVSTLATTLPDGTTYTFADIEVTCEGGRILAQSPRRLAGSGKYAGLAQPFLHIEGLLADLPVGEVLELPVDGPGGSETYPLTLFFALTGGPDANELSSAVGDASGTVEITEATCGPEPRLALTVDAVLGSEVRQESMPLRGELR